MNSVTQIIQQESTLLTDIFMQSIMEK